MSSSSTELGSGWVTIIQTVKTPLGFFTLVVLFTEVIFGIITGFSEGTDRAYLIWSMIGLIFLLVVIVAIMGVWRSESLSGGGSSTSRIVSQENQLEQKRLPTYGNGVKFEEMRNIDLPAPIENLRQNWNSLDIDAKKLLRRIAAVGGGIEERIVDSQVFDFVAMNQPVVPTSFPKHGLTTEQVVRILRRLHNTKLIVKVETADETFYCLPQKVERDVVLADTTFNRLFDK
jgi:hypothetical protein